MSYGEPLPLKRKPVTFFIFSTPAPTTGTREMTPVIPSKRLARTPRFVASPGKSTVPAAVNSRLGLFSVNCLIVSTPFSMAIVVWHVS